MSAIECLGGDTESKDYYIIWSTFVYVWNKKFKSEYKLYAICALVLFLNFK